VLKLMLPFTAVRLRLDPLLVCIAEAWIACNSGWMALTQKARLGCRGNRRLDPRGWYLVNCNHQSWADILVLQHLLTRRIPLLKFFLKQQLRWVPVMGLAWWALDFPFMRRHSEEVLKAHPELRRKDQEATRLACQKFSLIPTSVMNFCEGTRFTPAKHQAAAVALSPPAEAQSRWHRAGAERDGRQVPRHSRRDHRLSRRCAPFLAVPLRQDETRAGSPADAAGAAASGDRRLCRVTRQCARPSSSWLQQLWQDKDAQIERLLHDRRSAADVLRPLARGQRISCRNRRTSVCLTYHRVLSDSTRQASSGWRPPGQVHAFHPDRP
jgi:1-acyl-sn-glycerol-3-phosphate acyltransferase